MNVVSRDDAQADPEVGNLDAGVVDQICNLVTKESPCSFFLFAGAGSGKTRTLIEVLVRLTGLHLEHEAGLRFAKHLRERARQIATITYTNNAVNEINGRLGVNPLVAVSTIHSFAWQMIQGFDDDIRAGLIDLIQAKIEEEDSQNLSRPKGPTKSSLERLAKWKQEVKDIAATPHFTYTPDKLTFGPGALNHTQVIQLATHLLRTYPTLARILNDRHPLILIDESQDTMRDLLNALIEVEQSPKNSLRLGLIGDHRQRIYFDGHQDLPSTIPPNWERPMLRMNHRSQARIVKLINRIWTAELDGRTQQPSGALQESRLERTGGAVRIFIGSAFDTDKPARERWCAEQMAELTGFDQWKRPVDGYRVLLLEHKLAARRGGFFALAEALEKVDREQVYKVDRGLMEGDTTEGISELRGFREPVWTIRSALACDGKVDEYLIMEAVSKWSPLLASASLAEMGAPEQKRHLRTIRQHIESLLACWRDGADPLLGDLVAVLHKTCIFPLHDNLKDWFSKHCAGETSQLDEKEDRRLFGIHLAMSRPWSELVAYFDYLENRTTYATHQGVKGSQFDHVMVVLDDEEAGGNFFSYDKLFGAEALSETDLKNVRESKETAIDRTLRLFYVTCSRPKDTLAVVYWSANANAARDRLINRDWFSNDEVIAIHG